VVRIIEDPGQNVLCWELYCPLRLENAHLAIACRFLKRILWLSRRGDNLVGIPKMRSIRTLGTGIQ
jgi:hypothetical protein